MNDAPTDGARDLGGPEWERVAVATQSQALNAVVFFFREVQWNIVSDFLLK
jgi:hypothetical protein